MHSQLCYELVLIIIWRDVIAFFHVPIRMSDTLFHNMCSLAHMTSSSKNDYGVTD